jgi:uncharacterized damage-inducible protein DinB
MQRAASSLTKFIGHRWILRQRTNALLTDVYRAEALRICGITGAMVDHGDSDLCGARTLPTCDIDDGAYVALVGDQRHQSRACQSRLLGCRMLEMLRDLVQHNGYANAALLRAIRENDAAVADAELGELLHHILLANRFWLTSVLGLPFDVERESQPSSSFDVLVQRYRTTHEQQAAWLSTATEEDLARMLESDLIPGGRCSVAQAFVQVCLHSHGHRAQCAKLLRRHGGTPPPTDFILWLTSRAAPEWAVPVPAVP